MTIKIEILGHYTAKILLMIVFSFLTIIYAKIAYYKPFNYQEQIAEVNNLPNNDIFEKSYLFLEKLNLDLINLIKNSDINKVYVISILLSVCLVLVLDLFVGIGRESKWWRKK